MKSTEDMGACVRSNKPSTHRKRLMKLVGTCMLYIKHSSIRSDWRWTTSVKKNKNCRNIKQRLRHRLNKTNHDNIWSCESFFQAHGLFFKNQCLSNVSISQINAYPLYLYHIQNGLNFLTVLSSWCNTC